ncbi:MAG: TrkH family potassium uptake protein [Alphaproteobacteria bacterium]|nr:TrkH family potassium uptake protein [Alphaproteobacteria bacterium]
MREVAVPVMDKCLHLVDHLPASNNFRRSMVSFRPILLVLGILLTTLAFMMCIPAAVDGYSGHADWKVFLTSASVTLFAGLLLVLGNRLAVYRLTVRQAFVLTSLSWVAVTAFGALPFAFSHPNMTYTNALFEAMSGLTTTGATVMVGLDHAPPGVLLWRALLNGLGGIGIIVMAVAVLPFLRVGGMQLFRTESSDRSDKILPKTAQMVNAIILVYLFLIALCILFLWVAGMGFFDAVCHGIAAVSTGGFSTKDASVAYFNNPWFDWILVLFMISGALPLTWYVRVVQKGWGAARKDSQVGTFLKILAAAVGVMTTWLWITKDFSFWYALRMAAFNVTSIITDTGFVTSDYGAWGHFAVTAFLIFPFIGGCTGSTAGAIKIFRWQILFRSVKRQTISMFQPHRIVDLRYNGQSYSPEVMAGAVSFVVLYLIGFAVLTLMVSLFDVDLLTSASAVAAAMANSGPGLGSVVGPFQGYHALPDAVIRILTFAMLFGRLELFTLLVLLNPQFWRD